MYLQQNINQHATFSNNLNEYETTYTSRHFSVFQVLLQMSQSLLPETDGCVIRTPPQPDVYQSRVVSGRRYGYQFSGSWLRDAVTRYPPSLHAHDISDNNQPISESLQTSHVQQYLKQRIKRHPQSKA